MRERSPQLFTNIGKTLLDKIQKHNFLTILLQELNVSCQSQILLSLSLVHCLQITRE